MVAMITCIKDFKIIVILKKFRLINHSTAIADWIRRIDVAFQSPFIK